MLDKSGTYYEVEKDDCIYFHPSLFWLKDAYLETPITTIYNKPNERD